MDNVIKFPTEKIVAEPESDEDDMDVSMFKYKEHCISVWSSSDGDSSAMVLYEGEEVFDFVGLFCEHVAVQIAVDFIDNYRGA